MAGPLIWEVEALPDRNYSVDDILREIRRKQSEEVPAGAELPESAGAESPEFPPPQAARPRIMTHARRIENNFFIWVPPNVYFPQRGMPLM